MKIKILPLLIITAFSNISYAKSDEEDFNEWLNILKVKALKNGINKEIIDESFKDIKFNKKLIKLDKNQPESFDNFWTYSNKAVSNYRVKNGVRMYEKYKDLLRDVEIKYGVPANIIVALWGLETNYGTYTGKIPTIEALATLSYNKRRRRFFTNELMSALEIIQRDGISIKEMKGSWAGALGQCQFMPSNYLKYAVDGNKNGKKDLWREQEDVFYSMGNFIKRLGWKEGVPWGFEVILPDMFDYSLADGTVKKTIGEWRKMGILVADNCDKRYLNNKEKVYLLMPYDHKGPAFFVTDNFRVIKRWNNSDKYALSVGYLSDLILGKGKYKKKPPKDIHKLTFEEAKYIQRFLNRKGYYDGKIDGIIGSKTKRAIRMFQKNQNYPEDGYPSKTVVKLMKQTIF